MMDQKIAEKKEWEKLLQLLKNKNWVSMTLADFEKAWKEKFGDERLASAQLRQVEKDLGFGSSDEQDD